MAQDSVEEEVLRVIKDHNPHPEEKIDLSSRLWDDLQLNTFRLEGVAIDLEEKFDLTIQDDDLEGLVTVGDLVNLIERLLEHRK